MQDDEFVKAFAEIAQKVGAISVHIARAWVCERCKDEEKEAHPYGVNGNDGNYWNVLCNECYDQLGCAYSEARDDELETPIMECPQCHAEQEDHDGFGVLYCEQCGYCVHASVDGDICGFCGKELPAPEQREPAL